MKCALGWTSSDSHQAVLVASWLKGFGSDPWGRLFESFREDRLMCRCLIRNPLSAQDCR